MDVLAGRARTPGWGRPQEVCVPVARALPLDAPRRPVRARSAPAQWRAEPATAGTRPVPRRHGVTDLDSPAVSDEPMTVELWADGACSGNPGPGGWAAVLR